MKFVCIFLIVIFLIFILGFGGTNVLYSSYGDACSRSQRCNPKQFLNCANGHFCDCSRPKSMIFDEAIDKCAKLIGEHCTNLFKLQSNNPSFDIPSCVSHAECNNDNTCQCQNEYFETLRRTCERKREFGESCSADEMCKSGLLCSPTNNNCTCPGNLIYNRRSKTCVKYRNSTMSPLNASSTIPPVIQDGCPPGLIRRNGTCGCKYKDHQEYSTSKQRCSSLIDGPCKTTEDCEENAHCIFTDEVKTCQCKEGYNSVERRCELAFGERCVQNDIKKCDRLGPLECSSNGKCECSDFQRYDNQTLKCKGLIGAKCNTKVLNFCTEGTICEAFRGFSNEFGICTCKQGLKRLANRTCN